MKLHVSFLVLCVFLLSASCEDETSDLLKPRGPRPVEPGFKADKCATEKDWPICTDDEWGRKCPSGCRIQGLLDQTDHEILGKIDKIRKLLDEGKKLHRSTDQESKNTYNYLRERLVSNAGNDNRFTSLAEQLRQRIVELKIKIDRQLRVLEAVKAQIKNQFLDVQRLEVDIDMKLRSCKGSCASYVDFSVEKEGFEALEKQLDRLDTLQVQSVETVSSLKVLKSRVLKDVEVPSIYKSSTTGTERAAQRKTFFTDVDQMQLSLEAEGSTAETAATVSKVSTGTSQSAPIISTTRTSSQTLSCTQTVRKVTINTKDGVQEKYETVSSGPGCDTIGKLGLSQKDLLSAAKDGKELTADGFTVKVTGGHSKSITNLNHGDGDLGGFEGDFFKALGSTGQDRKFSTSFTSSSSSSSKSITSGGTKGFHLDTKSITATSSPFDGGEDLGAFFGGDIEDDVPDLHARSLKSRDERKADFIGGVCESVGFQKRHTPYTHSRLQCGVNTHRMCSDEDEEIKCSSGCRLQGFIDETDRDVYQHVSNICEKIEQSNAASSSTLMKTAEFYEAQRRIFIKSYKKELHYAEAAEMLHKNLTLLQEKSTRLSQELQKYLRQTEDQMNKIHQVEKVVE
ncbi:fibrinogen alpha chain isoform X2 [Silurus meridionalis]|uniref:fibrinogen alpha chain isoform X2 n=1 Tax=Silurus meridionalis TaxID=175797 RepID=UPI001EEB484F|nr:fibrinogen alpha chain isoform X2 [Silurus meridionalis]